MDKHKVDKSIKDFFDKRTIEPNSQIWDRLDAILEVTDDKVNQKSKYFWQGLAASIVFVLSMSLLIYYVESVLAEVNASNFLLITYREFLK